MHAALAKMKALSAMAELDRAQGKYEEAKELYLEALKTARIIEANSHKSQSQQQSEQSSDVDMTIIHSIVGFADILYKAEDEGQSKAVHKKVRNMLVAAKQKQKRNEDDNNCSSHTLEIHWHLAQSHTLLGCLLP